MQIIWWAPRISQVQSNSLTSNFLRARPCVSLKRYILCWLYILPVLRSKLSMQCFVTKAGVYRQTWAFLLKIKYLLLSQLNDPENNKPLNWKTKLRSVKIRAFILASILAFIRARHYKAPSWFFRVPSFTRSELREMSGRGEVRRWGVAEKTVLETCKSLFFSQITEFKVPFYFYPHPMFWIS